MEQTLKSFLTTGEFAKLCRTTKETLFHYDSIGVLKPDHIGENGYRYYIPEQFYDYDLIATLKTAGSSLSEIKNYLSCHNIELYIDILQENRNRLKIEREKIDHMDELLKNAIFLTQSALSEPCYIPKIVENKEEYYIATQLEKAGSLSSCDEINFINNHFQYCEQNKFYNEFPLGAIVDRNTLLSNQCYESYYTTKIKMPIKNDRLFIKPAGRYLTMLHKGFYNTRNKGYDILFNYIKKQKLTICGHAYEHELISYLAVSNIDDLVLRISIQIE